MYLRAAGEFDDDVQVMSGYLSDDGSFYTVAFIPEAWEGGFNYTEFKRILRDNLLDIWAPQFDEKTEEDAFQAMLFEYTSWPYLEDKELNRDAFNMMITDAAFGYLTDKQLLSHSAQTSGHYKYNFGYRSNGTLIDEGFWNNTAWAGVPHSAELPYVFGWALMQLSPQVRIDSCILIDIFEYNVEDFEYADFMIDLWTNFAKYGNPTPEPIEAPLNQGPTQFSEFTPDAFRMMNIAREVKDDIDYRSKYNAFFASYLSYIIDVPLYKAKGQSSRAGKYSKGLESTRISDAEYKMAKYFLQTTFPGEYDYLFPEDD